MTNHERDSTSLETAPLLPVPAEAATVISTRDPVEKQLSLLRGLSIGLSLAVLIFLQSEEAPKNLAQSAHLSFNMRCKKS